MNEALPLYPFLPSQCAQGALRDSPPSRSRPDLIQPVSARKGSAVAYSVCQCTDGWASWVRMLNPFLHEIILDILADKFRPPEDDIMIEKAFPTLRPTFTSVSLQHSSMPSDLTPQVHLSETSDSLAEGTVDLSCWLLPTGVRTSCVQ